MPVHDCGLAVWLLKDPQSDSSKKASLVSGLSTLMEYYSLFCFIFCITYREYWTYLWKAPWYPPIGHQPGMHIARGFSFASGVCSTWKLWGTKSTLAHFPMEEFMFDRCFRSKNLEWAEVAQDRRMWPLHRQSWIRFMLGVA